MRKASLRQWAVLAAICAAYAICALRLAAVHLPFCDEGWLASPGWNLVRHGTMETSVIETAGSYLKGVDRFTYWTTPGYPLGLSVWYRLFGFGALQMRSFSTFWGVVALIAVFFILGSLMRSVNGALLGVGFTAAALPFLSFGSTGRMDMMSAGLGFAALACYLELRERRFAGAVFVSCCLLAASVMSHPNGLIHCAAWLFLVVYFDLRRIRMWHLAIAGAPFAAAAGAWAWYVSEGGKDLFVAQFSGNATTSGRQMFFHEPWRAMTLEITRRYADAFGFGPGSHGLQRLAVIPLLCWIAAWIAAVAIPKIRNDRFARALMVMAAITAFALCVLDGVKRPFYLVYVIPFLAATLALVTGWMWRRFRAARIPMLAGIAALFALQIAGAAAAMRHDAYHATYMPAIEYLEQHDRNGALIMGPSELGFELGYTAQLVDDFRLGYNSGKHAAFIVIDPNYRSEIGHIREAHPEIGAYIDRTLANDYRRVFENGTYTIYESTIYERTNYERGSTAVRPA